MKRSMLSTSLRKLNHFRSRTWCGCLTSTEILLLLDKGFKLEHPDSWLLTWCIEEKASGNIKTHWVHFILNEEQRKQVLDEKEAVRTKDPKMPI